MQKHIIYDCTMPPAGGLADRIKGIVSCYALAKKLNRNFIINWTYPHQLNQVLACGRVDWRPVPVQGTVAQHFAIDTDNCTKFLSLVQHDALHEDIQIIRTNMNFIHDIDTVFRFKDLFEDLFTLKIPPAISIEKKTVGICARFGGNQSNWHDFDFGRQLSFEQVLENIIQIKNKTESDQVFVCSDSNAFISFLQDKIHFITTPHATEHMDRPGCSIQGFIKSFHDFFLLRQCKTIVSTKGGFAHTAAFSSGKTPIEL